MGESEVSARSFGQLEGRVGALEDRSERLDGSIDTLNKKIDKVNGWFIGLVTTVLINVVIMLLQMATRK